MKRISSRENPFLKTIVKLNQSSKERFELKKTVLDGIHLIETYIQRYKKIETIILSETAYHEKEISNFLSKYKINEIILLPDELFNKISPVKTPTGILTVIDIPRQPVIPDKLFFCVLLEDIQDAGNVGSILRSAAAAGAQQIFLSNLCADAWSPKTLRAAMGAQFFLEIYESTDLIEIIKRFTGKIIATSPHVSVTLSQTDLSGPIAFVMGNEGAGLSETLLNSATQVVNIAMPGAMESLNVAAATAICLFEKIRQDNKLS